MQGLLGEGHSPATGAFEKTLEVVARFIEAAGVGVIVIGIVAASLIYLAHLAKRRHEQGFHNYRSNVGRAILLGLELLVAADIILTVAIDPTLQSAAVLGLIVLIRTFLSFTLEVEIKGYWPWRDAEMREQARERSL